MLLAPPLAARHAPQLPWWVAASLYGAALWVFALYVMAHLIAGNPAFLGFTGITWVALIGHVIFALVAAAVVRWRDAQSLSGV
jgi:Na+/melibiose symporter-like transporter